LSRMKLMPVSRCNCSKAILVGASRSCRLTLGFASLRARRALAGRRPAALSAAVACAGLLRWASGEGGAAHSAAAWSARSGPRRASVMAAAWRLIGFDGSGGPRWAQRCSDQSWRARWSAVAVSKCPCRARIPRSDQLRRAASRRAS
jgi:hypothetical protein